MKFLISLLLLLGRICLSLVFLVAGFWKLTHYSETVQLMAMKGLPAPTLFYIATLIIEIPVALLLLVGYQTRWIALILILYLIPVTLTFHDFWYAEGANRAEQMYNFLKNIAIMGGLLYVLGWGAGGCSCDRFCRHHKHEQDKKESPKI